MKPSERKHWDKKIRRLKEENQKLQQKLKCEQSSIKKYKLKLIEKIRNWNCYDKTIKDSIIEIIKESK